MYFSIYFWIRFDRFGGLTAGVWVLQVRHFILITITEQKIVRLIIIIYLYQPDNTNIVEAKNRNTLLNKIKHFPSRAHYSSCGRSKTLDTTRGPLYNPLV